MLVNLLALQCLVAFALPRYGHSAGRRAARPDGLGRLPGGTLHQLSRRQCWHLDMQVDPVEQRPAEFALVAVDLIGRAAAGLVGGAQVTTGAGVHGTNQLKACRKLGTPGGARNGDAAGLQRLTQGFQRGTVKLRQLVQKQHPVVCQGDFPWARWRAAADQGHCAGCVVRAARGPLAPACQRKSASQTGHRRTLQGFVRGHDR